MLPNQGHVFNGDSLYKRFTPAGPDHAQVAACAGMVDYIDALAAHHGVAQGDVADLMRRHETEILTPLLDYLKGRQSLRILGPTDASRRAPTVAIDLGQPAEPVAAQLAEHAIMAGGGDFYAGRALEAMHIRPDHGVLRLSFVHYTTADEVSRLIKALDAVLDGARH
jgi:selenocysteine lyase/cysteine desulfurase